MVRDGVRSYLGMAAGIGTLTRQRAVAAARAVVSSGEATAEQVSSLADDLLATSRANREAVAGLVRVEVERALGRLGLATAEDIRTLTARLAAVEGSARAASRPAAAPARKATTRAPAKRTAAKAEATSAPKQAGKAQTGTKTAARAGATSTKRAP